MEQVIKILHLEDVSSDAEFVERELRKGRLNFTYKWVNNKIVFEKALEEFAPDIVLCDHSLPSYTSLDAIKLIRAKNMKIPFILITATLAEESVVEMIKEGMDDYIIKDRLSRLPSAVLNVLAKKKAELDREKFLTEIISQEKRFRALIENLSEAIVLCDADGKITFQSPAAGDITGISSGDALGKSFVSFFHKDDADRLNEIIRQAVSNPSEVIHTSFRIFSKNRKLKWLEGSVTNLLHDANVNALIINYHDITERKMAEQLQIQSEANIRAIFDNTQIAYLLTDQQFRIVSFNNKAASFFKKEFKRPLTETDNLLDYYPAERKEMAAERLRMALSGVKINYQSNYKQADNQLTWYNIEILPVGNEAGGAYGLILTAEDITERKNIELEKEKMTSDLLQHNKNLEQFAYIISHNLRSPVANILGLSNLMQNSPELNESDFARCMEGLALSVKKLDEIIIDLNYILQVRREINEKKELVKFPALVKDIKTSINNLIEKENIQIKTSFSGVDEFFTIKSYLNSIFYNLISNSIKYRHPERPCTIEISSKKAGDKILLSFRDNGLGIDLKAYQSKVFGLYKKFHPQVEGKGMGLYMVKTQVEILGGSISVKSDVNRGTEFLIEFNA